MSEVATRGQLEQLAAMWEPPPDAEVASHAGTAGQHRIRDLLDGRGLEYREHQPDTSGVTWYHLRRCPFHEDGPDFECGVGQKLPDGPYAAHCFHNRGRGKGWQDFKSALGLESSSAARPSVAFVAPEWPDPLAGEAFHGLAGDIVRAIEPHTEADSAALLIQFLVALGNAVGRGPYFEVEATRHYLNLFAVIAADTSKGRKGTSWGHVERLLESVLPDWARENVADGLSSGEGLIYHVRDQVEKQQPIKEKGRVIGYEMVVVDEGARDKRLLVMSGEYATVLKVMAREGNTLSPTLRSAWDHGNLRTLTRSEPLRATDAHISLVGHITATEVKRHLDRTEAANGWGNRHLWVCARRSKVLPEGGRMHEVDVAPLVTALNDVTLRAATLDNMTMDDEARETWYAVYPALSEGKPGLLGAMIARAEAQVMRLACLYAVLDCSQYIQRVHMEAALAVWDYCESSARFIFGEALGDPVADEILRALRATPDGLSRTQIRNLFSRHGRVDQALGELVAAGLARMVSIPTGGRPEERWFATKATKATKAEKGAA